MVVTFGRTEMDRVVRCRCVVRKSWTEGGARGNVTNAVRSTRAHFCGECGNEQDRVGILPTVHTVLTTISTNVRQRAKVSIPPKSPKKPTFFQNLVSELHAAFEK